MASFKRLKLFVNLNQMDSNNLIYDEVWIYRLNKSNSDKSVGRYRIRYQKSDSPLIFSGTEDDLSNAEYGEVEAAMAAYGPAVLCYLEVWTRHGWKKCLDWMGDPSTHYVSACSDLNDQYRSFLTGQPILDPFVSSSAPKPPREPSSKKDTDDFFSKGEKPPSDPDEFDWI